MIATKQELTRRSTTGKTPHVNLEIGPDVNKPYVQVVKQQVKIHQDDLHEILVKLHISSFSSELRHRRYEQYKSNMALMQNTFKHQANTLKTRIQHEKMKLHAILSKFHIEHTQNGATVQHIHSIQVIATICPKQQLGILQPLKQHATAP